MDKSYFFLIKALLFGISAIVAIPRELFKKFFLWGFVFGGLGSIIQILLITQLHFARYANFGIFGILGRMSFWTPIAWMFAFMIFFYFLPARKTFLYLYIPGFAVFGFMVGLVLQNLKLYFFIGKYIYFAPFVYLAWFGLGAWTYIRNERVFIK